MALLDAGRLPARLTAIDRATLAIAAGLSSFVAWRIERRAARVRRLPDHRVARLEAERARAEMVQHTYSHGTWR